MELQAKFGPKHARKPVGCLVDLVSKSYGKRHARELEPECAVFRGGARLAHDAALGDALASGDAVTVRARRRIAPETQAAAPRSEAFARRAPDAPATARNEGVASRAPAAPRAGPLAAARPRRKRLVRVNLVADPN